MNFQWPLKTERNHVMKTPLKGKIEVRYKYVIDTLKKSFGK